MSVPVPQRGEGKLEVNTLAKDLVVYTLKITANKNVFTEDQDYFIQRLNDTVVSIHLQCWRANNIKVGDNEQRYKDRIELQACNDMEALIEIAKPLFHLRSDRVSYWTTKVTTLRNKIRSWKESDVQRLKPKDIEEM